MRFFFVIALALRICEPVSGQNIFIAGRLSKEDGENIKSLFETIRSQIKAKKLTITDQKISFNYDKKNPSNIALLDGIIQEITQNSLKRNDATLEELNKLKIEILRQLDGKGTILTFDINETNNPPISFQEFEQLIEHLYRPEYKKKKFAILFIGRKLRPVTRIDSPLEGKITNTNKVEGSCLGSGSIKEVWVKTNEGNWHKATGTSNWGITEILQPGENRIKVIAIDFMGDSSMVGTVGRMEFVQKIPEVKMVFPANGANITPRCLYGGYKFGNGADSKRTNGVYSYIFKFSVDGTFPLENLSILIESDDKSLKREFRKEDFTNGSDWIERESGSITEICFIKPYNFYGCQSHCCPQLADNFYITFKNLGQEKVKLPAPVLIHFDSFDDTAAYEACNCN